MILGHRITLCPTTVQVDALRRACGVARFTYNWALDQWNKKYAAGEKTSGTALKLMWNKCKHVQFPWVKESPKDANQRPFANLDRAFHRFFKKISGRPVFKSKGKHDSFYVSNDQFLVCGNIVRLPVIGEILMCENLRLAGRIMSGTVSREAGRWFLSIQVDVGDLKKSRTSSNEVGVDLGVKTALALSDGQTFTAPKPLKAGLRKLRRLSKSHSRKQKGSNNRKKSQRRLARYHARIKNIRRDWTHKVTTKICRENQTICLEDLNVKGMTSNRKLARAINDVGFYEIRRQLEYKAPVYGSRVIVINRWLPTSKTCSQCAAKKDSMPLAERIFHCGECGLRIDRDLNAARNILAAGLAVSACGPESSGSCREAGTKLYRDEAGTTRREEACLSPE